MSEISACTIKRLVQQAELFLLWTGSRGINGRYIPHKTFFSFGMKRPDWNSRLPTAQRFNGLLTRLIMEREERVGIRSPGQLHVNMLTNHNRSTLLKEAATVAVICSWRPAVGRSEGSGEGSGEETSGVPQPPTP